MNVAIIVAAGSSSRMGNACADKLMLKINKTEVLARTMLQYQRADSIDRIYVVTSKERFSAVETLAQKYQIDKFAGVTEGGKTRQHSVQNGLKLCTDADIVSIADGARPFTKPELIDKVTATAKEHGGALLCVPVKDTLKVLSENGFIDHSPDRNTLLAAQTPQAFNQKLFAKLMDKALKEGKAVTDDASIFEMYGQKVCPVISDYENIKITTPEDILQAEAIAVKEKLCESDTDMTYTVWSRAEN